MENMDKSASVSLDKKRGRPSSITNRLSGDPSRSTFFSRLREPALAAVFIAPALLLFGIFLFYPLIQSVYLSLHSTNPRGQVANFVGLANFRNLFASPGFPNSLIVTLKFILFTVPASLALALAFAAICRSKIRGMRVFRFIFALPIAVSVSTGSIMWMVLFHPTLGSLNVLLGKIGFAPIQWLTDPNMALLSISLMTVWMNIGFLFILLLGGMQGIPEDIYESAKIDGSGPLRTFWRLTLPLVSPTLFFASVTSVIGAFQAFGQINILTKGGPVNSTDVLVFSLYEDAFVNFRFGVGSAQALVLFAIVLLITVLQFVFAERKVHYQ
ncbi:carbohydrate ABC transporter permease [Saccharibacillus sp. JS10]|uniref:carbohydrate ABC transporter permease n=1 Tax=Saccharibacillus sp. JS10 TaxID=2950552 RepID=UPI00210D520D|nr:sugar ABC transporter permease [Saccharibacillus sp. JS10]MCQ4086330.1 sugar ABC transporter permease [Saccharibacillus sp. JS10]